MFKSELIYVCHSSIFFSLSTPQSCQKSECSIAFVFLSFQKGLENEHTYSVLHSLFRAFLRDKILAKSLRILAFPNYIKAPKICLVVSVYIWSLKVVAIFFLALNNIVIYICVVWLGFVLRQCCQFS